MSEEQLCFTCQHAVPNEVDRGCPWSMFGEPVPGWDAVERFIPQNRTCKSTYNIKSCPLYLADEIENRVEIPFDKLKEHMFLCGGGEFLES